MTNLRYICWLLCGTYIDQCAVHIMTTVRYILWQLYVTYIAHCAVHFVTTVQYIWWPLYGTYRIHSAVMYWPLCGTYSNHCTVYIVTNFLSIPIFPNVYMVFPLQFSTLNTSHHTAFVYVSVLSCFAAAVKCFLSTKRKTLLHPVLYTEGAKPTLYLLFLAMLNHGKWPVRHDK